MNIKIAPANTQGVPDRLSQPNQTAPQAAFLAPPRAALIIVALSSLGLWSAIWWAATSLASGRLW